MKTTVKNKATDWLFQTKFRRLRRKIKRQKHKIERRRIKNELKKPVE